jgi:hypothetical protein
MKKFTQYEKKLVSVSGKEGATDNAKNVTRKKIRAQRQRKMGSKKRHKQPKEVCGSYGVEMSMVVLLGCDTMDRNCKKFRYIIGRHTARKVQRKRRNERKNENKKCRHTHRQPGTAPAVGDPSAGHWLLASHCYVTGSRGLSF